MSHSDILELLIQINRIDIIYSCHMKNAEILQQKFGKLPGISIEHGNYFIGIRTGFTISILTVWLKGGRKETPEELVEIIKEQLFVWKIGLIMVLAIIGDGAVVTKDIPNNAVAAKVVKCLDDEKFENRCFISEIDYRFEFEIKQLLPQLFCRSELVLVPSVLRTSPHTVGSHP